MKYIEFWIADYLAKTTTLELEEHGAYMLLLLHYCLSDAPLPNKMTELYKVCKANSSARKRAVNTVVEKYFYLGEDGLLHQNRVDEEIEKYNGKRDRAIVNGAKGGRPKKEEPKNNPEVFSGFGNDNPEKSSPSPIPHSPYPIPHLGGDANTARENSLGEESGKGGFPEPVLPPAEMPIPVFVKPTWEQVSGKMAFASVQNPDEEAKLFVNYYDSVGWVRPNGSPIRQWEPMIPAWVQRGRNSFNGKSRKQTSDDKIREALADPNYYNRPFLQGTGLEK